MRWIVHAGDRRGTQRRPGGGGEYAARGCADQRRMDATVMAPLFGLALDLASASRRLDEQLSAYLALIQQAEALGFDSVSAGESYPQRRGGGHLPSPLLALAALARGTTLRLGTGVILLPAWNPLRLAYDCAVLDQISGGRLFLGVGLGNPAVARRFGRDPAQLGAYMDDALAALRALWAGEDGY